MNLTVLIPTSPIPSHPSTAVLDETISNVRKYTQEKILILFDGIHESLLHREADYLVYKASVIHKIESGFYGDCGHIIFNEHTHQARMTRFALDYVTTPLILFCEHDTSPIGDIPFDAICYLVEHEPTVNYMRFNIFHMILPEHRELMTKEETAFTLDYVRIDFTRTIQWSQRPHIAKTQWYRDILENHFGKEHKTMIEDVMHSVVQVQWHEKNIDMGLTIYTPEGNQLRSYHSDARGTDKKIIEA